MAEGHSEEAGISGFVAQALNICGIAAVSVYDVGKAIAERAYDIASYGLERDEENQLTKIVREYERRKEELYYLIGRQYLNLKNQEEQEAINQYISEVLDYEKTITQLKNRITELKELQSVIREQKALLRGWKTAMDVGEKTCPAAIKDSDAAKKEAIKAADDAIAEVVKLDKFGTPAMDVGEKTYPTAIKDSDPAKKEAIKAVDDAIAEVVKLDKFGTPAAMVMFKKVATDLLDSDLGNKVLAVTELGKIGNNAAVPILVAAVNFRHPELIAEIIKTLTAIGDSRAIPLMYQEVANSDYRVRSACLRGLFKLTDDEKEIPVLINGLHDKHSEVRRTAVTLLGWKDSADDLPALTQCLKDKDVKVRKAAVLALANIKNDSSMLPLINILRDKNLVVREKALDTIRLISGQTIEFDVRATGTGLTAAINNLKDRFKTKSTTKKEKAVAPAVKPVKEPTRAEGETAQIKLDEMALTKMKKVELLSVCLEHGIKCDATMTKTKIIEGILTGKNPATTVVKTAKASKPLDAEKPPEVKR